MAKKKKKTDEVNEPALEYGSKQMVFFKSLEEMNDHDALEMANMSPIDCLKNATSLIKRAFANELKKDFSDFSIHFK